MVNTLKPHSTICVIIIGIYYPVIFAPFNSIDDLKMINQLLNVDSINLHQLFFPHGSGQYYRPLLFLTFLVDGFVWGLEESFMHLENILLHIGSALLLFAIANRIVAIRQLDSPWLPLGAALLFGLHPIAAEPVNWVSGRTDVMAGLFVLASLLLFLKGLQEKTVWLGSMGALLLLAGCLSKETALFILPVLLLWCLLPPRDIPQFAGSRPRLFLFGTYLSAGLCYLAMRWSALAGGDKIVGTVSRSADSAGVAFTVWDLIRVGFKTSGFYFKKLLMPLPLNFGIVEISPHYFWLGLLVCIGLLYCVYLRTIIAYLFLAAFCLVSPALILPLLRITWTPVAERYVYIASAPFVLALALLFVKYVKPVLPTRVVILLVALLLGSAGVVTAKRNMVWQDNLLLFEDTVKKSPDFPAARNELAIALYARGRAAEAHQLLLANGGDEFQSSALNKVRVYMNKGELQQARFVLLKRLESTRDVEGLELLNQLNDLLLKQVSEAGKSVLWQEMLTTLQELYKLTNDPFYQYRIGQVQLRLGDKAGAKQAFTKAWQGSSPNSHYRDAARKLAERL